MHAAAVQLCQMFSIMKRHCMVWLGEFSGSDGFSGFRRGEWLNGDDALGEKRATKIAGKTSGFHKNPIF